MKKVISKTLVPLLIFSGCSQKIVSYNNPKAAYQTFETYLLVSPKMNSKLSEETSLAYELIAENIQKEMSRRGYEKSTVSPDLTLRYDLTSSTRVETTVNQSLFFPVFQVNTRTIHEGVLLIELYDPRKKLVWQGSYDLDQERKEKRVKKVIENSILKIFTTYPYRAAQRLPDPALTSLKKK
ncbi:MAG: DUF4136 domain-containing protein [Bacteroidota bacterium]